MIRGARGNSGCPICGNCSQPLLGISFPERRWLYDEVSVDVCTICEFAFVYPADDEDYAAYYAETANDLLSAHSTNLHKGLYSAQASNLKGLLDVIDGKNVLDIGCGSGGLLRHLQKIYPQHQYLGVDPSVRPDQFAEGVVFKKSLDFVENYYDVIIFSHTLEHVVDLYGLPSFSRLLTPNGRIYVEVPDALRYINFPRREYLYYFDRLHVNHFTPASLVKIIQQWGLVVERTGQHEFSYKDGMNYPACYAIAGMLATAVDVGDIKSGSLLQSVQGYISQERSRFSCLNSISVGDEVLVYGFGDNFFRARSALGPLSGRQILGVIDQRSEMLARTQYSEFFKFYNLEDAVALYSHVPVVVTVSWGGDEIVNTLVTKGFKTVFIL